MTVQPKTPDQLAIMRDAGAKLSTVIAAVGQWLEPGQSLLDIDGFITERIKRSKAEPAFLGYHGFPAASCLSLNEVVVHGIPNKQKLHSGDILGVDIGLRYRGFNVDSAFTFPIGQIAEAAAQLLAVTRASLDIGVAAAITGNSSRDIGVAIEQYVNKRGQYGIVRALVGHGVGETLQEPPEVPNYAARGGVSLKNNMTLAIEPMLTLGSDDVRILADDWTVVTADNSLSAHYEMTIAVHDNKPTILTPLPDLTI